MLPGDHGFLAAVLSKGMRAATVGVDAVSGSGGLIWPGDRVDLILTQTIEDQALPIGHRLVGEAVLQDVRVVAVDQQIVRGAVAGNEAQTARTITLEVTPEQAERVAVATRLGKLQVVVRSAETVATSGEVALPIKWASDVSAALAPTETGKGPVLRVFSGPSEGKEYHFP
jgi:pilus assembly protein CpaB